MLSQSTSNPNSFHSNGDKETTASGEAVVDLALGYGLVNRTSSIAITAVLPSV